MSYEDEIIRMVKQIKKENYLKYLYTLVKELLGLG